jgi:NAD(P)-dependent dehydrogenase (short-subunit alcohol dehydrogenase family)
MGDESSKIWLITGVSSGLGRALAEAVLDTGDLVVGTVRSEADRISFEQRSPGRAMGRLLDLAQPLAATELVADVEREIGPIDVLVNNAGYGHEAVFEELLLEDLKRQFDVNVFGLAAVTQAVLPFMRRRRQGRIINISSALGVCSAPGIIPYSMSKFAVEGLSEGLAKEMRPFGVRVTTVKPGAFRTDWNGRSLSRTARSIPDYDEFIGPLLAARAARDGVQNGDPQKFAAAILLLAAAEDPPVHLVLGPDCIQAVREKLYAMLAEMDQWERLGMSTNFGT